MLSINTNMTSLLVKNNLTESTKNLNTCIERMSTGFRINSAKDDAAGYTISTDIETNISSFNVAKDNAAMGSSLVSTATSNMDILTTHLQRIRDLCEEASNDTYSAESRTAIQTEIDARVEEINRIINSTEYNDIKLFTKIDDVIAEKGLPTASKGSNGNFISNISTDTPQVTITDPTQLLNAIQTKTKIGIGNAATLAKLAELVNNSVTCSGKTIILTDDIDLSAYSSGTGWTPIGNDGDSFNGIFNGNGHVISNLYINSDEDAGLFGCAGSSSIIKNVGIENCNITSGGNAGGLTANSSGTITNCYVTGTINGDGITGGLTGQGNTITYCYTNVNISGGCEIGGLAGYADTITNCFSTGDVSGTGYCIGGLAGGAETITKCYSTGNISGDSEVGGLAGDVNNSVSNSISFAQSVTGDSTSSGSLVGTLYGSTTKCECVEISGLKKVGDGSETGINYVTSSTTLQIGIKSDSNSRLSFSTSLSLGSLSFDVSTSSKARSGLNTADNALSKITKQQTTLGAVQNRLDSISESIDVSITNLTSSLSTIKDADIAEESSSYIKQQILQQACTSLLTTANQSASIALQLI